MTNLTHIARLLPISGVNLTGDAVGGPDTNRGRPESLLVYGALGLGDLDEQAAALGLAIYVPDRHHDMIAGRHLYHATEELATRHHWEFGRHDKQRLQARLASLAILELRQDGKCMRCNGTGSQRYQKCRSCDGTGERSMRQSVKCRHCELATRSWVRTWQARYDQVYQVALRWKGRFDAHVVRYYE
ncbi:MAG: hypothetical protein U5O39_03370 [Gammaproteobacteria bacterium]|nr:hypothetical protein [Gammaproteobacteria bacterium]